MQDPTAQQLQHDLEFMRRMYARSGPQNHRKSDRIMTGLIAFALIVPAVAALLLKLL